MSRGLVFQIEQHSDRIRRVLRDRLLDVHPEEFEELATQLLAEVGSELLEVTRRSDDGGIDVRGPLVVGGVVGINMGVQVKKWKLRINIQSPIVHQIRGCLGAHLQVLIIATSNFSKGAVRKAAQSDKPPFGPMDGEQLVTLMMERDTGVERTTPDPYEIEEALAAEGTGKGAKGRSLQRRSCSVSFPRAIMQRLRASASIASAFTLGWIERCVWVLHPEASQRS